MSCTKKDKFVPFYPMMAHTGHIFITPLIFNLDMVWRWEVNFMPWRSWYSLNRKLGGPQSQFACLGEDINLLPPLQF